MKRLTGRGIYEEEDKIYELFYRLQSNITIIEYIYIYI